MNGASFLQSRMYQAGVRCSDCHDAHSGKVKATGNALCVRCHEATRFDVEAHSHHAVGKGPLCIDCHMPPATFMQIDERRDHSIRIPRPDHSVEIGATECVQRLSCEEARNLGARSGRPVVSGIASAATFRRCPGQRSKRRARRAQRPS